MKKLGFLFIALVGFAVTSNAQVSATAKSSATIVTPISIVKAADLDFGLLAVSPTTAGTATITTAGVVTGALGVTKPVVNGSPTAASFTVNGDTNHTFSVNIVTASITLTRAGGGTMTLDTFVTDPVAVGTLVAGTATVNVGGTLHVAAGATAGLYENASGLEVMVNYN